MSDKCPKCGTELVGRDSDGGFALHFVGDPCCRNLARERRVSRILAQHASTACEHTRESCTRLTALLAGDFEELDEHCTDCYLEMAAVKADKEGA